VPAAKPTATIAVRATTRTAVDEYLRLGDLLFDLCQLARRLGLSAEDSLRAWTTGFVERFRHPEEQAPRPLPESSAEDR
jgi:uncharacterized protein YabN with tetrapyrrole methylase and pyrophosphatase domain